MKGAGKTWKEIADAMNRPQAALKKRWREIGKPDDAADAASPKKKDDAGAAEKDKQPTKSDGAAEKKKAEKGAKGANPKKANSGEGEEKASKPTKAASHNGDMRVVQRAQEFSTSEIDLMEKVANKDKEVRWLEVASRLVDKNGRRVAEDEIQWMFGQS